MKHKLVCSAFVAFLSLCSAAGAHEFKIGAIEIGHPWSRPTPPSAPVASGYVKLTNSGSEADRLIEVVSPESTRAEIHRSILEDGVAKMRPVEGGVVVEPGQTVDFEAERLHIMFIEPKVQLKDKDKFPATLVFEKAGRIDVEFMVQRKANEPAAGDHNAHGAPQ